jgi:hypothetical protein
MSPIRDLAGIAVIKHYARGVTAAAFAPSTTAWSGR